MKDDRLILVFGAGGHSKVVLDSLHLAGYKTPVGLLDPGVKVGQKFRGIPVIGNDDAVLSYKPNQVLLVNGIGQLPGSSLRADIFERFKALGYQFLSVIHPSAVISPNTVCMEGAQVLAGAVLQPGATVGENTICNTRSSVDHDSVLGKHVHVAPGAVLCGNVRVGDMSFIGAGAVIAQGTTIGARCIVGAASFLDCDIDCGKTYYSKIRKRIKTNR